MSDIRPEYVRQSLDTTFGVIEKPLGNIATVWNRSIVRKTVLLVLLATVWELYARYLSNELLFPSFSATISALWSGIVSGGLISKALSSIQVLLMGYASGMALAALLTAVAISGRLGTDLLETLTAMFNPLPAIALLPLALIWFGFGNESLIFVIVHSVLWAVALNTHTGFRAVSATLRMVGRNYGLRGLRYMWNILVPAAFPSILSGMKIGWAFAWRTLIAAELVFGVSSGSGGLGWFIFENKMNLEIPSVFAGLLTVILIGLAVENFIFAAVEKHTVRKWGMQV